MTRATTISRYRPNWENRSEYPSLEASSAEWSWEFLRRNSEYSSDFAAAESQRVSGEIGHATAEKWGLLVLWNPQSKYPHFPLFLKQYVVNSIHYTDAGGGAPLVQTLGAYQAVVAFDLRFDIGAQLEKAKRHLEKAQLSISSSDARNARRIRCQKTLEKLRVWDARAAGASNREIVKKLWPREDNSDQTLEKRVNRRLHEARQLIDGGYLSLINVVDT